MLPRPGASVLKIGSRCLHDIGLAADHQAVAALQSPDAAAGADVDVMDALGLQFLGAANIVDVIRIAAIDDDVAFFHARRELPSVCIHDGGRHHQPDRARRFQLAQKFIERTAIRRRLRLPRSATASALLS